MTQPLMISGKKLLYCVLKQFNGINNEYSISERFE